jgi:hypothetical protein
MLLEALAQPREHKAATLAASTAARRGQAAAGRRSEAGRRRGS